MKQEVIRIDLDGVNCYLGKTEDGFILFDTGGHITLDKVYTNRLDKLRKALKEAGCVPGKLKVIILTHGDNDHVANVEVLREEYSCPVAMHKDDIRLVRDIDLEMAMESFRYRSIIYKIVFFIMKKTIQRITEKVLNDFTKFTPNLELKDGDSLKDFGFDATVVHLPGHTAGSIGIMMKEGDMIAGDILVNVKKPDMAPNAADFKQMKKSIQKLRGLNPTRIYPGHGEPFDAVEL